ncbi:MAG: hypothetical protein QOE66_563 [Chloroflexota bacterium]|nr:hypothetical protein [Chloroflexota bacterium]
MDRLRRRLGIGLLQLAIRPRDVAPEPPRDIAAPVPPLDGSLAEIRRASVFWERRPGPGRRVVDQKICLVPDLSTFLEAIARRPQGRGEGRVSEGRCGPANAVTTSGKAPRWRWIRLPTA